MAEEEMGEVSLSKNKGNIQKVGQDQIHGLLFSDKLSWQAIIYDLINTEQLNPWDIDIVILANRFLEKVKKLEEANFFITSKVLLAASLLLRMKSEILLHQDIPSLDFILYGKKEEKKYVQERIELDEEIPGLVPRTPLPRFRKVSLEELMAALGKAIKTETRRITKVVLAKQQEMETSLSLPKKTINLKDRIKDVHDNLINIFSTKEEKLPFSHISGNTPEEKRATFIPLLHLDNQQKIWVEQYEHFGEIWILLKEIYEKQNKEMLEQMKREVEEDLKNIKEENLDEEGQERAEELEGKFKDPLEEKSATFEKEEE